MVDIPSGHSKSLHRHVRVSWTIEGFNGPAAAELSEPVCEDLAKTLPAIGREGEQAARLLGRAAIGPEDESP